MELKRGFLWAGIGSLCLCAFTAIFIFLFGTFGELEMQLLFTTLVIGLYGLVMFSAFGLEKKFVLVTLIGLVDGIVGVFTKMILIWGVHSAVNDEFLLKTAAISLIASFSIAHSALLLKVLSEVRGANLIVNGTIGFVGIVGFMLAFLILAPEGSVSGLYLRLLAVFGVLDLFGTALACIAR